MVGPQHELQRALRPDVAVEVHGHVALRVGHRVAQFLVERGLVVHAGGEAEAEVALPVRHESHREAGAHEQLAVEAPVVGAHAAGEGEAARVGVELVRVLQEGLAAPGEHVHVRLQVFVQFHAVGSVGQGVVGRVAPFPFADAVVDAFHLPADAPFQVVPVHAVLALVADVGHGGLQAVAGVLVVVAHAQRLALLFLLGGSHVHFTQAVFARYVVGLALVGVEGRCHQAQPQVGLRAVVEGQCPEGRAEEVLLLPVEVDGELAGHVVRAEARGALAGHELVGVLREVAQEGQFPFRVEAVGHVRLVVQEVGSVFGVGSCSGCRASG